jgi:signal transduction histidine kinase
LLQLAHSGGHRVEFLQDVSVMLLELSGCDALEIRLSDRGLRYRWRTCGPAETSEYCILPAPPPPGDPQPPDTSDGLDKLCSEVLSGKVDRTSRHFTPHGSYWSGDTGKHLGWPCTKRLRPPDPAGASALTFPSLVVIPFAVEVDLRGLLLLQSRRRGFLTKARTLELEAMAHYLGLAVATRRAEAALRERVKELTCLYGLALLTARSDLSLNDYLQSAAELLPPAWHYPELAAAQVTFDGRTFRTRRFGDARYAQSAPLVVDERPRGEVEVRYFKDSPELGPQPFLEEERHLIDAVAAQLAMELERRQTEHQRLQLETQLRHADRLATIGQLAAGVAHELNEPLGNILGLAQLVSKSSEATAPLREDVQKIIDAALHAREIIRSLMLFARQTPPQKVRSDLNLLVEESLTFLEARCAKAGVVLRTDFAADVPGLEVDPVQIRQVVLNLAVNAVQAMQGGGTLTVTTRFRGSHVVLMVKDTGVGMTEHVQRKLFMPFFTTKAQEGTGLGLSVTHGIVTAHGGSIHFESAPGQGSTFEVHLPVKSRPWEAEDRDYVRS